MNDEIITQEQIEKAFHNTNFGGADHRKLLEQGVLTSLTKYRNGHTLTLIMQELGFINKKNKILKKGKGFLYESFHEKPY